MQIYSIHKHTNITLGAYSEHVHNLEEGYRLFD